MKFHYLIKSILSAAIASVLLVGSTFAANTPPSLIATKPGSNTAQEMAQSICVYGKVTEITTTKNGIQVLLENSNKNDPYQKIILAVSDKTIVLDAVNGNSKLMTNIKANETLYAYVSPAMTRSMPPIANAALIICNIPADFAVPTWAEIKTVTEKDDGKLDVLMSGEIVLHLDKTTELMTYNTEKAANLTDIQPGTHLLSWYSVTTMSMPAQANPKKVMVFPKETAAADDVITRQEFIDLLYATVKNPIKAETAPFVDVKDSASINWAFEHKITSGVEGGKFAPDDTLTRAELLVFLMNYATDLNKGPVGNWAVRMSYADVQTVPEWAISAAMWNQITEFVLPDEQNNILPMSYVTLEQANVALQNLLERK